MPVALLRPSEPPPLQSGRTPCSRRGASRACQEFGGTAAGALEVAFATDLGKYQVHGLKYRAQTAKTTTLPTFHGMKSRKAGGLLT